jgi:hypothetical protein
MADTAAGMRSVRAGGQLSNLRDRAALSSLRKILYSEGKSLRELIFVKFCPADEG